MIQNIPTEIVKILAIIILLLTCITMVVSIIVKPTIVIRGRSFSLYWIISLIGAILMIIFVVPISYFFENLLKDTTVNPIKILILFISMSFLSIYLDECGFFSYLADTFLQRFSASPKRFFVGIYLIVSILTIFTSNDIVVLTFTPFILYYSKRARINPIPFLFTEFVAANTWSMFLIIGNPTNIYLAGAYGIDFIEYFENMVLPTISSGIVSLVILYLLFRKELNRKVDLVSPEHEKAKIKDKGLLIIGLSTLGVCIVLLTVSSYINLEMWIITLGLLFINMVATSIYVVAKKEKIHIIFDTVKRGPYQLVPFVISMFTLVLGIQITGITDEISSLLMSVPNITFSYGLTSFLSANIINNIPMSILYSELVSSDIHSVYAAIIGSNLGAILSPIGALAGIMWCNLLKQNNVKFSFAQFVENGLIVSLPSIFICLLVLAII